MICVAEIELPTACPPRSTNGFDLSEGAKARAVAHRIIGALVEARLIGANPVEAVVEILLGEDLPVGPAEVAKLRDRIDELESAIDEARSRLLV